MIWLVSLAWADEPELNADPWRPQVGAATFLVQDADKAPDLAAGAWLHHVHDPLVYVTDGQATSIVRGSTAISVAGAWGVDRWRFQLGAPIHLASSGAADDRGSALGDLGLDARAWLAGNDRADVAATGRVAAGLGGSTAQLGEPGFSWELGLAAGVDAGPARVVANAAYKGVPGVELENVDLDDAFRWGLGASLGEDRGAALELVGQASWGALSNRAARPTEATLSGFTALGPGQLRASAGTGISAGIGSPRWRVGLGYEGTWEVPPQ